MYITENPDKYSLVEVYNAKLKYNLTNQEFESILVCNDDKIDFSLPSVYQLGQVLLISFALRKLIKKVI